MTLTWWVYMYFKYKHTSYVYERDFYWCVSFSVTILTLILDIILVCMFL